MFKKGNIINRWHNTGAFGNQMVFGEIIRVNRKTVTVKWERGNVWRISPRHIELVTGKLEEEVREKYFQNE